MVTALVAGALHSPNLSHFLAELMCATLAALVVVIGWHSFPISRNHLLLFLSSGFAWVAIFAFAHLLSYTESGFGRLTEEAFSGGLWSASRFYAALVLFAAPGFLQREFGRVELFIAQGLVAAAVAVLVLAVFPPEPAGSAVHLLVGAATFIMLIAASVRFWPLRQRVNSGFVSWMLAALGFSIVANLMEFGAGGDAPLVLLGQASYVLAFWCVYRVVAEAGLRKPLLVLETREQQLRQVRSLYEHSSEGMIIASTEPRILAVNPAFTRITGYSEAEAIGHNPRILQSGRHDRAFYVAMWQSLVEEGVWRGEIWNRRRSGEIYPEWLTISAVHDAADEVTHYVSVLSDISALKRSQERMEYLAHHDPLTGLPNRLLCRIRLSHALERAQRNQLQVGVIFLDLDGFKDVNDNLGHSVGDGLLKAVARRLEERMRRGDTIARLGGDEFLFLLEEISEPQAVGLVAESILRTLDEPFVFEGHEIAIGASLGVSLYPQDGADATTLMKNADLALYRAKAEGRNNYQFFTASLAAGVDERVDLEMGLRHALTRGELSLAYQPLVMESTGEVIALESMLRWNHPEHGCIPPERFIPIAEQTGLIVPIGEWVLRRACRQLSRLHQAGYDNLRMAVNVSGRQLKRGRVAEVIPKILRETGVRHEDLELELAEVAFFEQAGGCREALAGLRRNGIHLTVDAFGTGFASIAHLRRQLADALKLDCSLVAKLATDEKVHCVVRSMLAIGNGLGYRMQAKGVESRAQLALLRSAGCHIIQGYSYSPALNAGDLEALLRRAVKENGVGPGGLPRLSLGGEMDLERTLDPPCCDGGDDSADSGHC